MRVSVQQTKKTWIVTALTGIFAGQKIAEVDGIAMRDVKFNREGSMEGCPTAVWGAALPERVSEDRQTLFGLGINRPFDMRPRRRVEFTGAHWADTEGKKIGTAGSAFALDSEVYFWGITQ